MGFDPFRRASRLLQPDSITENTTAAQRLDRYWPTHVSECLVWTWNLREIPGVPLRIGEGIKCFELSPMEAL